MLWTRSFQGLLFTLKWSIICCYKISENVTPPHSQTKTMKGNENCYIELKHLLKISVSWPTKYCHLNLGKLVFKEKMSDKSLSKIPFEIPTLR